VERDSGFFDNDNLWEQWRKRRQEADIRRGELRDNLEDPFATAVPYNSPWDQIFLGGIGIKWGDD